MNKEQLVSFDLEIAQKVEGDWEASKPLGITCAATAAWDGQLEYQEWAGRGHRMNALEARRVVTVLWEAYNLGYRLVTVNGASFDFVVLAEESGKLEECANMALGHYDLCFAVLALKGWPVGLDAFAKGMNVEGKLKEVRLKDGSIVEDMSGARAPDLWAAGERAAVLEYLREDVRSTWEVGYYWYQYGQLEWVSKKGKAWTVDTDLMTVRECLELPQPDQTWMTEPMTRESALAWIPDDLLPDHFVSDPVNSAAEVLGGWNG